MREGALHDCPELFIIKRTERATAFSSASAKTKLAPLPPSSRHTRLSVPAAATEIALPARVEPVKEIISTSSWVESWVPTPNPSPFTRLNTPSGTPASCTNCANNSEDSGASSDGFKIQAQPAKSAGMTLSVTWFMGQFQGVISPTTPIGS